MGLFVLDSYAVLAYLNDEAGAQDVEDVLRDAQKGRSSVYLNWVSLGEIYCRLQKAYNRETARKTLEIIKVWPVDLLQAEEQLAILAGDIKAKYDLSFAGAFAAASAASTGGTLLTGDAEFKPLENEAIKIKWMSPDNK
ncbi:MAG: PIN domain-containing protein [Peptococcaceae bacterium]|nr:PIN domain-containing protein [Peptococcaceae bacterium]